MYLHEAMEKLFRQVGRSMTTKEIAEKLTETNWYRIADGSLKTPSLNKETEYIRGSTLFKEYSYITRILPSVHVTCVIPDPAMTLFIFFTGPTPGRTSQKL